MIGAKDRATNTVTAEVIESTDRKTLEDFVIDHVDPSAMVYTDDAAAYNQISYEHETVRHSVAEYVRDQAHTNGIESFWSMLKRGHKGVYHKISPKHLQRYINEFAGRHNIRNLDTTEQMAIVAGGLTGRFLPYQELVAENGLDSMRGA